MGQGQTKDAIVSRRSTAFTGLTPRADVFTVGSNKSPPIPKIETLPLNQSQFRASSVHSVRAGGTQTTIVGENPYMLQRSVSPSALPLRPILRNRSTTKI